ncbi:MAG: hypothetical protein Q8P95_03355 [bacterium]|nr:hypothetical protein [bacterium]
MSGLEPEFRIVEEGGTSSFDEEIQEHGAGEAGASTEVPDLSLVDKAVNDQLIDERVHADQGGTYEDLSTTLRDPQKREGEDSAAARRRAAQEAVRAAAQTGRQNRAG